MPIHDWNRVDEGIFHDFHNAWITWLRTALNTGLLPPNYYALTEQLTGDLGPDVVFLRTGKANYPRRQRTLVIRHTSDHAMVALLEIVSPGSKSSKQAVRGFVDKLATALSRGLHLLVMDLFPPRRRLDPQGVHGALWNRLGNGDFEQPADKPLTFASYVAETAPTAYVEPAAISDQLPDMPLFLDAEWYINVPLEATYQAAYAGVPEWYRKILEAAPS